jgi:hypothetical protein
MRLRLRHWFEGTRGWSTWQHVVAGTALIVAAATVSSLLIGERGADAVPAENVASTDVTTGKVAPAESVATEPSTSLGLATASTEVEGPAGTASVPPAPSAAVGTTAEASGLLDARDVLAGIPIELENRTGDYDRDLFAVWIDADGDGCDTRDEVLLAENLAPVESAPTGCIPTPGLWRSTYDGMDVTDSPQLDVDHLVSLKEAWDSGAWAWDPDRRIAYANDLTDGRTLVAVSAASNRSKGDRDPSNWIPEDPGAVCPFIADWIAVKARWSMTMDESEHGRLRNLIDDRCPGLTIEPWPDAMRIGDG